MTLAWRGWVWRAIAAAQVAAAVRGDPGRLTFLDDLRC
jgi:hypothetical protein